MVRHTNTGSLQIGFAPMHSSVPRPPRTPRVCADCHQETYPLYQMNGQRYCGACLDAWCTSLPAVQADVNTWAQRAQEEERA